MGEPGTLSPDESERFREDRLRLVCRSEACLVIRRNSDVRFLVLKRVTHPRSHDEHSSSLWLTMPERVGGSPVLALLSLGLLVAACHLSFTAGLAGRAHLNGGVLEGRGRDGDLVATLVV